MPTCEDAQECDGRGNDGERPRGCARRPQDGAESGQGDECTPKAFGSEQGAAEGQGEEVMGWGEFLVLFVTVATYQDLGLYERSTIEQRRALIQFHMWISRNEDLGNR